MQTQTMSRSRLSFAMQCHGHSRPWKASNIKSISKAESWCWGRYSTGTNCFNKHLLQFANNEASWSTLTAHFCDPSPSMPLCPLPSTQFQSWGHVARCCQDSSWNQSDLKPDGVLDHLIGAFLLLVQSPEVQGCLLAIVTTFCNGMHVG